MAHTHERNREREREDYSDRHRSYDKSRESGDHRRYHSDRDRDRTSDRIRDSRDRARESPERYRSRGELTFSRYGRTKESSRSSFFLITPTTHLHTMATNRRQSFDPRTHALLHPTFLSLTPRGGNLLPPFSPSKKLALHTSTTLHA